MAGDNRDPGLRDAFEPGEGYRTTLTEIREVGPILYFFITPGLRFEPASVAVGARRLRLGFTALARGRRRFRPCTARDARPSIEVLTYFFTFAVLGVVGFGIDLLIPQMQDKCVEIAAASFELGLVNRSGPASKEPSGHAIPPHETPHIAPRNDVR